MGKFLAAAQFLPNSSQTVGVVIKDQANNYQWLVSHVRCSVQYLFWRKKLSWVNSVFPFYQTVLVKQYASRHSRVLSCVCTVSISLFFSVKLLNVQLFVNWKHRSSVISKSGVSLCVSGWLALVANYIVLSGNCTLY